MHGQKKAACKKILVPTTLILDAPLFGDDSRDVSLFYVSVNDIHMFQSVVLAETYITRSSEHNEFVLAHYDSL